jgi:hypothetical protein
MKIIINENPQKYYYGQTNPLKSENPCPLPRETKQLGKGRGLRAWDLLKDKPRFKVTRTQKEVQECCRPSFDHPKILHILIDRAAGYGSKKLAAAHGGSHTPIGKFCQSMGFDVIKPHEVIDQQPDPKRLSLKERAIRLMEAERVSDLKSIRKFDEDKHWGNHLAVSAWKSINNYYIKNPDRPVYMTNEEKKQSAIDSRRKRRQDPINRMKDNAGKRSRKYIKTPGLSWAGFGCTSDEYRAHMEKQFTKRMTWDNYGTYWHDDHIRPVASFDWNDPEQRRQCEHYTNKQPLEAKKNIDKSDSWDGQLGFNHMLCA